MYLHDPVASVTRPDVRLIGYRRLELEPGESRRVTFRFHAELSAFTDRKGRRVVEPGDLELRLAASSAEVRHTSLLRLTGPVREVGTDHAAALRDGGVADGVSSVRAQRLEPPPMHRPSDQPTLGFGEFGELGVVDRVPPREDQDAVLRCPEGLAPQRP